MIECEGFVENRFAGFVFIVLSAILIEKCNHYINTVVSIVVANSTIFEISLINNIAPSLTVQCNCIIFLLLGANLCCELFNMHYKVVCKRCLLKFSLNSK